MPRNSVVVSSYNQARFLPETLDSICRQDYPDQEVVVMDGGSSGGSVAVIESHAPRLRYWQSRPDGGQSGAINEGMRRCTGALVTWLNSDDAFWRDALLMVGRTYVAPVAVSTSATASGSSSARVGSSPSVRGTERWTARRCCGAPIPCCRPLSSCCARPGASTRLERTQALCRVREIDLGGWLAGWYCTARRRWPRLLSRAFAKTLRRYVTEYTGRKYPGARGGLSN